MTVTLCGPCHPEKNPCPGMTWPASFQKGHPPQPTVAASDSVFFATKLELGEIEMRRDRCHDSYRIYLGRRDHRIAVGSDFRPGKEALGLP